MFRTKRSSVSSQVHMMIIPESKLNLYQQLCNFTLLPAFLFCFSHLILFAAQTLSLFPELFENQRLLNVSSKGLLTFFV